VTVDEAGCPYLVSGRWWPDRPTRREGGLLLDPGVPPSSSVQLACKGIRAAPSPIALRFGDQAFFRALQRQKGYLPPSWGTIIGLTRPGIAVVPGVEEVPPSKSDNC